MSPLLQKWGDLMAQSGTRPFQFARFPIVPGAGAVTHRLAVGSETQRRLVVVHKLPLEVRNPRE